MEKVNSAQLETASRLCARNGRFFERIKAVLEEDADYAADEIIALSEELLSSLAAIGFHQYIVSQNQNEEYNDFLFGLFNGVGSGYNAGPLFRWAANMVFRCATPEDEVFKFFWVDDEGEWKLNEEVNQLADLRNRVMHGFFLLPADENNFFAELIGRLLLQMHSAQVFKPALHFHFTGQEGFSGNWKIRNLDDWKPYFECSDFGKRAKRIIYEESNSFWQTEDEFLMNGSAGTVPMQVVSFFSRPDGGAMAIWHHPSDQSKGEEAFRSIGRHLMSDEKCISICYRINESGCNFTVTFLLHGILRRLCPDRMDEKLNETKLKQLILHHRKANQDSKIIVLVNGIHFALFSAQHLTSVFGFLFECGIKVVSIGCRYRHLEHFFADSLTIPSISEMPGEIQAFYPFFRNYFRFRTSFDIPFLESADIHAFNATIIHVLNAVKRGGQVYARRFADEHGLELEGVLEGFDALYPWVEILRLEFEEDDWDEATGAPAILTESTQVLLALGRTDLSKEYKHLVLST